MLQFSAKENMRLFEILIPILLAFYVIWKRPRPLWIQILPAFTLGILLLHLSFEGYRWQMIPLYVLTAVIAVFALFRIELKRIGCVLTLIFLAVGTALPILLPVPSIPLPSGPYKVGTR